MTSPSSSQEDANTERNVFPGFGLPVERKRNERFSVRNGFDHPYILYAAGPRLTNREIRMMEFMNQITDKPNWVEDIFDNSIVDVWQKEVNSMPTDKCKGDVFFSKDMFDYCIEELRIKATGKNGTKATGIVNVLDAQGAVAKSDKIVPASLAEALKANIKSLEDFHLTSEDWKSKSDKTVLNLVDPSLYPVVYGTTRALPHGYVPLQHCASVTGQGKLTQEYLAERISYHYPDQRYGSYQWLPSDITWTKTGPKISSYINNLHPEDYADLYKVLEDLVAAAISLWGKYVTLDLTRCPRIDYECRRDAELSLPEGLEYPIPDKYIEYTTCAGRKCYRDDYKRKKDYRDWMEENKMGWPEPRIGLSCRRMLKLHQRTNLKKEFPSGIQVIFKITNIYLSPENPRFSGSDWGTEGTSNENIVATAIYDYDAENITESKVTFKENVWEDPAHGDKWHEHELYWYDLESAFSEIGSVCTKPGRMLAFPSRFLEQIEPFELRDPTKPGYKKYLTMFLVNPRYRTLSTKVVPPQQRYWWIREVSTIFPFSLLPLELLYMIMDFVFVDETDEFVMDQGKAEKVRDDLISERLSLKREWEKHQEDAWEEVFLLDDMQEDVEYWSDYSHHNYDSDSDQEESADDEYDEY
ncbi:hypothetical protein F5Y02DRAFT_419591 [Annulohypoxylon stygium]|nr:hypothetical protein F5Y02DRAFT_419591 [Annulohypoxylon stygium]